jgi:hypothetical protein
VWEDVADSRGSSLSLSGELGCPFSSERVVSGLGFRWNFVTNAEIFHARSQKSLDDADASF